MNFLDGIDRIDRWNRLVCKIRGHNWKALTPPGITEFVECQRCGETGWRM